MIGTDLPIPPFMKHFSTGATAGTIFGILLGVYLPFKYSIIFLIVYVLAFGFGMSKIKNDFIDWEKD